MVILPHAYMTLAYFGYTVGPFGLLLKDFIWVSNLLIINVYLMKVIIETCSVHYIRYLCFYKANLIDIISCNNIICRVMKYI